MELCEKDIESLGFIFLKYENSKIVFINNSSEKVCMKELIHSLINLKVLA